MSGNIQPFEPLDAATEAALRASIEQVGVLVPVVKDQHGRVLDGHHRSRIARELGVDFQTTFVTVEDDDDAHAIATVLGVARRHLSREDRQRHARDLRGRGHSLRAIAGALGVSEGTVRNDTPGAQDYAPESVTGRDGKSYPARRPAVVQAKDQRDAGKAQEALVSVDLPEGKVLDAAGAVRAARTAATARIAAQPKPEPPEGRYRTVVIDPPWPMGKITRDARPQQPGVLDYPTQTLDQIAALPIPNLVDPAGAHVYLWVTHRFLPAGLDLLAAWDCRYECSLTWVKPTGITPYSWMYNTEHVLFARAGRKLDIERKGLKLAFEAPTAGHSVKPDEFYSLVEQASPGPRIDLYARRPRAGWATWGNQIAA